MYQSSRNHFKMLIKLSIFSSILALVMWIGSTFVFQAVEPHVSLPTAQVFDEITTLPITTMNFIYHPLTSFFYPDKTRTTADDINQRRSLFNDHSAQVLSASNVLLNTPSIINFNIDAFFKESLNVTKAATVEGTLTAPNIIYSVSGGTGISVTGGQRPIISSTGVSSLGGQTGAVSLIGGSNISINGTTISASFNGITSLNAGTGISVSGSTITNSDTGSSQNIFKTIAVNGQGDIVAASNSDTLTFAAGNGIALTTDPATKKVTIAFTSGDTAWKTTGSFLYPTDLTASVGVGTSTPAYKFEVNGSANATTLFQNGNAVCDSSGNCTGTGAGIGGSGTTNFVPKFTSSFNIGNSILYDDGTNLGVGTTTPTGKINSLATTEQLRLSYNGANFTAFTVGSGGNLTIAPSGGTTIVTGTLSPTNISAFTLTGNVTGSGSPTLSGLGTINGATLSGGTLSGGQLTGGTYTGTGFTVAGNYTGTIVNTGSFSISDGTNTIFSLSDAGTVGNISNIGTLNLSGAITGATATNTINGLVINSGSLSSITGYSQTSGNFSAAGGTISLNADSNNTTNLNTGTSAGSVNIGGGSATINLTLGSDATGDLYYRNSSGHVTRLAVGSGSQILSVSGGIPTWTTGSGTLCSDCLVNDPTVTQIISPTNDVTGLAVRQTTTGSPTADIFNISNSTGITKYFRVDSTGNVILGAGSSTGIFTISPASTDPIAISPIAQGAGAFTGTISSIDLTAPRTWSFPDDTGTVCLATGNCAGTGSNLGGSGTTNYISKWTGTFALGNSLLFDDGTNVGINTAGPDAKLDVLSTTEQLRLTYTDGSVYSSFTVNSSGDLTLAPSGGDTSVTGTLTSTGVLAGSTVTDGTTTFADSAWTSTSAIAWDLAASSTALNIESNLLNLDSTNTRVGIGTSTPSTRFDVLGATINTDADNTIGIANFSNSLSKNDANTRTFAGVQIKPTINSGGSNLNTTLNVLNIDTTNSAVTGVTTNLIKASYGGVNKYFLDSSGNGYFAGSVGIGVTNPSNALEVRSTTSPQLRVAYDASNYSTYSVSNTGAATIAAISTLSLDSGSDRVVVLDKLQASGVFLGPAGAVGGPTFSFTNDINTGMYESGLDTLELVTSGANRLTIDSTGLVGIGTTSPGQKLTVDGTFGILEGGASPSFHTIFQGGDQAGDLTYTLPTSSTNGALTNTAGVLSWEAGVSGITGSGSTNYIPKFTSASAIGNSLLYDDGTNVGIGDTSPAAMLTVGSGDLFQVNSSGAIAAAAGITSSGTINFSTLSINSAVYTDGSKNLTSTAPSSGAIGYLSRTGTTLSPTTAGDNFTTTGNISTTSTGTITSAGLLTGSNGLTLTTGALNLTGTSGALTLSGLTASSIATTGGADLNFTTGHFNTTSTGINSTAIGATTASTGAFTTLTSTPASDVAALTVTGTNVTSANLINVSSKNTSGTLVNVAYNTATLAGAVTGQLIDLSTTVTNAAQSVTGLSLKLPATTAASTTTLKGLTLTGGAVTNSAGTSTWTGLDINMPAITQSAGTLTSTGLKITGGTVTSGTSYALTTDVTAGNVGIGTTTPGAPLEVANSGASILLKLSPGTGLVTDTGYMFVNARAKFGYNGTLGAVEVGDGGASKNIVFMNGGSNLERMRIDTSGNVGIGTTAPGAGLEIASTTTGASSATSYGFKQTQTLSGAVNTTAMTAYYGEYKVPTFNLTGTSATVTSFYGDYTGLTNTAGTIGTWYGNYIAAPTGAGTTSTKYAFVTESGAGNVGIGTTTPGNTLDVTGTGRFSSTLTASNGFAVSTGAVQLTSASTSSTASTFTTNNLTSGKALLITSTNNSFVGAANVGSMLHLNVAPVAATGSQVANASLEYMTYSPTYSTNITTPSLAGGILSVNRAPVTNASFVSTLTVSGALATFTDNATATTGAITSTADVMNISQLYANNSGTALNVTTAGTGLAMRINDDGTFTDSTPFVVDGGGSVGIGLTNPGFKLDINGTLGVTGAATFVSNQTFSTTGSIIDLASGSLGNTFIMKVPKRNGATGCGTGVPEGLIFQLSAGTQVGHACVDSTNQLTFFAQAFTATSTDLAENYSDATNSLQPGDVVMTDSSIIKGVTKSTTPYQSTVLGVVSTDPGLLLSDISENGGTSSLVNPKPVALKGRVPVKVSTENGPIQKGDFLTSSSTQGVAMKATKAGMIVGQALEDYSNAGVGSILVYVNVTYADPQSFLATLTLDANGNVVSQGHENGSQNNQNQNLADIQTTLAGMNDRFSTIEAQLSDSVNRLNTHDSTIASMSASLTQALADIQLLKTQQQIASGEGVLGQTTASDSATFTHLLVTEDTHLNNVSVLGTFNTGILSINGIDTTNGVTAASINTATGPLRLQSDAYAPIEFEGAKITMTTDGTIKAETVTTKKLQIDTTDTSAATLGRGLLQAGTTSVLIHTTAVTSNSQIFLTPKVSLSIPLSVTSQVDGTSFKVEVTSAQGIDIPFSWFIVDTQVNSPSPSPTPTP